MGYKAAGYNITFYPQAEKALLMSTFDLMRSEVLSRDIIKDSSERGI